MADRDDVTRDGSRGPHEPGPGRVLDPRLSTAAGPEQAGLSSPGVERRPPGDARPWNTEHAWAMAYAFILPRALARVRRRGVRCASTAESLAADVAADLSLSGAWGTAFLWLGCVINSRTRDRISSHFRHQARLTTGSPNDPAAIEADGAAVLQAEGNELDARVTAAVGRLTLRQREVFILRYGEELTHEEIAARLGIKQTTSRARLYRARRRLEKLLGVVLPPDEDD